MPQKSSKKSLKLMRFSVMMTRGLSMILMAALVNSLVWVEEGARSNIDPEELFRTIFGDKGSPFGNFSNFSQGGGGGAEHFDFGPKEYHVNLTFQQAAQGVNKDMYVSIMDTCDKCKGENVGVEEVFHFTDE